MRPMRPRWCFPRGPQKSDANASKPLHPQRARPAPQPDSSPTGIPNAKALNMDAPYDISPICRHYDTHRKDISQVGVGQGPVYHLPGFRCRTEGGSMTDDLDREGLKDQVKGTVKEGEGRVRNAVGGLTGDTSEQLKGKGQ